jgi:hypothetical protein
VIQTELSGSGQGPVEGSHEHGKEFMFNKMLGNSHAAECLTNFKEALMAMVSWLNDLIRNRYNQILFHSFSHKKLICTF